MIGTWRMAFEGIVKASKFLYEDSSADDAIEIAIKEVEDYPFYKSVGYGGLPNELGEVELDAAFMNGNTLGVGAVAAVKNCKNPISIARKLSKERFNSFLVGDGAERYATIEGFKKRNMLSDRAILHYEKRRRDIIEKNLSPYDGHDTVGMIALDKNRHMAVGTSTSGLFMKKPGRVGDSPIVGSGFYVDEKIGGASCTGLGEDIMKGCLAYEAVRRMEEGLLPNEVAQPLVNEFVRKLEDRQGKAGAISIIVMNKDGNWAIGTNVEFSFVVSREDEEPIIYVASIIENQVQISKATKEFLEAYQKRITSPI